MYTNMCVYLYFPDFPFKQMEKPDDLPSEETHFALFKLTSNSQQNVDKTYKELQKMASGIQTITIPIDTSQQNIVTDKDLLKPTHVRVSSNLRTDHYQCVTY